MKKKNLATILKLAVTVVFMSIPFKAENRSVMDLQMDKEAREGGFSTLILKSFGNYGVAGLDKVRHAKEELTLGLVKGKGLDVINRGQFGGAGCSQKGWLSKAPLERCPQAVTLSSVFKTHKDRSLTNVSLKENSKVHEKVRTRRVSRLQDPGEAMGGGREKHNKEDAKKNRG
jgi:hypothetical protein